MKFPLKFFFLFAFFITGSMISLFGGNGSASTSSEEARANYTQTFTVWNENDFWGHWSDKYYTDHFRLAYSLDGAATIEKSVPETYFFSLGQELYTPADKDLEMPRAKDHPYAAFLYVSGGYAVRDETSLISIELQLGVLGGESSLGYEVQKTWHHLISAPVPRGWESQIHDQLGANLLVETRHCIPLLGIPASPTCDLILRGFTSIGTVRTNLVAGAQFRFGKNLPKDFGFTSMRESTSLILPSSGEYSFYTFLDFQGSANFYDGTLGGELFYSSATTIKPVPFTFEASIGIGLNYGRWSFQIFQSFRSKDFYEADKHFFAFGGFRITSSF